MLDPVSPFIQPVAQEDRLASTADDRKKQERSAGDSRRLSSLRQTIRRWDNRAKAKGYDTILECLEAAPVRK